MKKSKKITRSKKSNKRKNQQHYNYNLLIKLALLLLVISISIAIYFWITHDKNKNITSPQPVSSEGTSLILNNGTNSPISISEYNSEDEFINELNLNRQTEGKKDLVKDTGLQNIANSMADQVVKIRKDDPSTKIDVPLLNSFFSKAGGNLPITVYFAAIGGGCTQSLSSAAYDAYNAPDSFARGAKYTKVGLIRINNDPFCDFIGVLGS